MQKVILTVKDESRLDFILELLNGLDYVDVEPPEDYQLREEHKSILDERLSRYEAHPEKVSSWADVKKRVLNSK